MAALAGLAQYGDSDSDNDRCGDDDTDIPLPLPLPPPIPHLQRPAPVTRRSELALLDSSLSFGICHDLRPVCCASQPTLRTRSHSQPHERSCRAGSRSFGSELAATRGISFSVPQCSVLLPALLNTTCCRARSSREYRPSSRSPPVPAPKFSMQVMSIAPAVTPRVRGLVQPPSRSMLLLPPGLAGCG